MNNSTRKKANRGLSCTQYLYRCMFFFVFLDGHALNRIVDLFNVNSMHHRSRHTSHSHKDDVDRNVRAVEGHVVGNPLRRRGAQRHALFFRGSFSRKSSLLLQLPLLRTHVGCPRQTLRSLTRLAIRGVQERQKIIQGCHQLRGFETTRAARETKQGSDVFCVRPSFGQCFVPAIQRQQLSLYSFFVRPLKMNVVSNTSPPPANWGQYPYPLQSVKARVEPNGSSSIYQAESALPPLPSSSYPNQPNAFMQGGEVHSPLSDFSPSPSISPATSEGFMSPPSSSYGSEPSSALNPPLPSNNQFFMKQNLEDANHLYDPSASGYPQTTPLYNYSPNSRSNQPYNDAAQMPLQDPMSQMPLQDPMSQMPPLTGQPDYMLPSSPLTSPTSSSMQPSFEYH